MTFEILLGAVITIAALILQNAYYKAKAKKLETKNRVLDKVIDITEKTEVAEKKAEKEEFDALSNVDPKDWRNKI